MVPDGLFDGGPAPWVEEDGMAVDGEEEEESEEWVRKGFTKSFALSKIGIVAGEKLRNDVCFLVICKGLLGVNPTRNW